MILIHYQGDNINKRGLKYRGQEKLSESDDTRTKF